MNMFKPPDASKRGILKIRKGFITQHSVEVKFEPYGVFEVPEDHYRAQGYEPEFEELPWKDEVIREMNLHFQNRLNSARQEK